MPGDSVVVVGGGKYVEIKVGSPDAILAPGGTRYGKALPEPLRALQDLIEDNRDKVSQAIGSLADLVTHVSEGRGSLGRFLREDTAYDGVVGLLESLGADMIPRREFTRLLEKETWQSVNTPWVLDPADR